MISSQYNHNLRTMITVHLVAKSLLLRCNLSFKRTRQRTMCHIVYCMTHTYVTSLLLARLICIVTMLQATYITISHNIHSRYMKRRCWFLDNLPAYNFNTGASTGEGRGQVTDTKCLGSTLMATMIREAEQFCHPCIEKGRDYHQVAKFKKK